MVPFYLSYLQPLPHSPSRLQRSGLILLRRDPGFWLKPICRLIRGSYTDASGPQYTQLITPYSLSLREILFLSVVVHGGLIF